VSTTRSYRPRSEEPATEQAQIQLRIQTNLRDRLQREASRRGVSVNFLGERALEVMVTQWEKQKLV
jgi:predicted HicB family RNase H-like nuclease